MINNIDFLYGFIYECTDLINNLYAHNNYDRLVIELCNEFILPIINITKKEHIKEYNTYIEDAKDVDNICSYLMNICSERCFKLSQNEYSKIKEFIDNNIDTVETVLAPIHEFFGLSKKCYNDYCCCPCNCHYKKIVIINVCVLLINIGNFVKKIALFLKKVTESYFIVEYIKFFYLLQKAIDQIISKKLNLYDENTCIRGTDMLITMFINLYHNSNIDCNKKVENKIYNLYQNHAY